MLFHDGSGNVEASEPSGKGAVDSIVDDKNVDSNVDKDGGFDAVGHVDVDGPFC